MNVLLTSAGRRSYLASYFKEALEGDGKVIASNSEACPAFFAADAYAITPLIYSDEYIPFLVDLCADRNIDLVIPLLDIDIPVLAENKGAFLAIGTEVVVPSLDIARVCNDKWRAYEFLTERGFCTPNTILGVKNAQNQLASKTIEFPLVVKPRWGMGSVGTFIAYNESELKALDTIIARQIRNSFLRYESETQDGSEIIVQEMAKGDEYGLDVICDLEGKYQTTIVKRKLAMRSGETDSAIVVQSPEIENFGFRISQAFPHPGIMDVDVFLSNGQCSILELNARFGGGYPFSHAAGVDLPRAIVSWYRKDKFDPAWLTPSYGTCAFKEITISRREGDSREQ